MTSLIPRNELASLDLSAIEARIDNAEASGAHAFRHLAELVAAVYHRELWRQARIPVGVESSERRPCKSFAEWCEVCREKAKTWGYQLVQAHAFSAIAENEAQARELQGLSETEARALVNLATDGGTRATTAAELRQLRASDAIAATKEQKRRHQQQLDQLRGAAFLKTVRKWAAKGRLLFRRQVGSEAADELIDRLVELAETVAA